jgi:hypothetical protein
MNDDHHYPQLTALDPDDGATQRPPREGEPLQGLAHGMSSSPVQDGGHTAEGGILPTFGQPVAPAPQYRRSLFRI